MYGSSRVSIAGYSAYVHVAELAVMFLFSYQMMLGLATHEPHFSLLREEVRFGRKSQRRQTTPDTITFHLLHLSIMREYIDFEFMPMKVRHSTASGSTGP